MANNNNKDNYSPTVYTGVTSFSNPEGIHQQSRLGISYWKSLMKVEISLKTEDNNGGNSYKYESAIDVYMPPVKAEMLSMCISSVLENKTESSGIPIGSDAYIGIRRLDDGNIVLEMIKYNEQKEIKFRAYYEFKTSYYLINDMDDDMNFTKYYLQDVELILFNKHLKAFVDSMTNTGAYANACTSQYDSRLNRIYDIAGKVGVEVNSKNNYSRGSRSSVFDNNTATVTTGSISDLQ